MMRFIWFCAAGYSFFIGVALLITSILLSILNKKNVLRLIIYFLVVSSVFMIFLSATPLCLWLHIPWIILLLCWISLVSIKKLSRTKLFIICTICTLLLSIAVVLTEIRYQLMPQLPKEKYEKLYVIGDSVSAGIGGLNELTWPKILVQEYSLIVVNLSESGATVASAMKQINQVGDESSIILLEIGGNDLFEPTPYSQFEKDLRELLNKANRPESIIVMLELPLQPWQIQFGRIQRKLAKEFDAILIPKRFFVSILSAQGASSDLAHLTEKGHKLMAIKVRELLKDCLLTQKHP
ncbi:MAG: SGNH/GDSL hydrolase family protein [Planctomycetota bacterium]